MTLLLLSGFFLYFVSIVSFFLLNVNLFNDFYFQILSRYEFQISNIFSTGQAVQETVLNQSFKTSLNDLIIHYSLVNSVNINFILTILFGNIVLKKLNVFNFLLSLIILLFSIYPNSYYSHGISKDYLYINTLSTVTYSTLSLSLFLLGIYLLFQYREKRT